MPVGAQRVGPSSPSERGAGTAIARAPGPSPFPAARRLRTPADFGRVLKGGRRRADALFTLVSLKGEAPVARLGIAVSKKVSKSAVQRNRIKRLVRESFRRRGPGLPALDIVVLARPEAAGADNGAIAESLERHFDRIERTCAGSHSS